jgi:hypothetical protein
LGTKYVLINKTSGENQQKLDETVTQLESTSLISLTTTAAHNNEISIGKVILYYRFMFG